jgi:bifunctional UDP-N-acetylglucosamine pyrophosphorylase/glucosamine-1-phosphate N-acetyltransferase
MPLSIIILAAGQGTRMNSTLPKVLHPLGGRPLLAHVLDTARSLDAEDVHVVIGHGAERVQQAFTDTGVQWVLQEQQLGTGHAVAQVMPDVPSENTVLVMYGDVPLIRPKTLEPLCNVARQGFVGLLTAEPDDPSGYGRILHHADGSISGIVEEKDASEQQRAVGEINTGFMAAQASRLQGWVEALDNDNAQGEFYLTDVIASAVNDGIGVRGIIADNLEEVLGINDRHQLAVQERSFQRRCARDCLDAGMTLVDPERFDLRGSLEAGQDVIVDVNVILEGRVTIGNSQLDPCR